MSPLTQAIVSQMAQRQPSAPTDPYAMGAMSDAFKGALAPQMPKVNSPYLQAILQRAQAAMPTMTPAALPAINPNQIPGPAPVIPNQIPR